VRGDPVSTRLFLSEGTWGSKAFRDLEVNGFRHHLAMQGFSSSIIVWSTDVDGTPEIGRPSLLNTKNTDWLAGAFAQRYRLARELFESRNFLTHSYGLAPVLLQATQEDSDDPIVPVRNVLAVTPPPRQDLLDLARSALERGTIASLRVIYADGWDMWARFGQVLDGHWGWRRDWSALKDVRGFDERGEKGVGHSGMFKPSEWHRFEDGKDFEFLKTAPEVLGV
jgi:hypothetical protein